MPYSHRQATFCFCGLIIASDRLLFVDGRLLCVDDRFLTVNAGMRITNAEGGGVILNERFKDYDI